MAVIVNGHHGRRRVDDENPGERLEVVVFSGGVGVGVGGVGVSGGGVQYMYITSPQRRLSTGDATDLDLRLSFFYRRRLLVGGGGD